MKSQKSTISAGREFCFSSDLQSSLAETKAQGYGFVVTPLFHPRRRRLIRERKIESIDNNEDIGHQVIDQPSTRSDLVISTDEWQHIVVPQLSSWINVDDPNEREREMSEKAFVEELSLSAHLGVSAVVYHLRSSECSNLARLLYSHFSKLHGFVNQVWITISACAPEGASCNADPWNWWDRLRTLAHNHNRIGLALVLGPNAPDENAFRRWLGEPVRAVFVETTSFLINRSMYPVLPKPHQLILQRLFRIGTQPVVRGHCRTSKGYQVYEQYLAHLFKTMPPKDVIENFAVGYEDTLQCPLQPLMDNLESQTYETFERDPTKYELYHQAVLAALGDLVPEEDRAERTVVLMVVGAGRGPLVAASLRAANKLNCVLKVYAVEKNPNAIVTLRNRRITEWKNDDVTIISSDMRRWKPPVLADILVSELLGSFGDNELSPECLDGAQHLLKPDTGISIPSSYTSYIAPVQTHRLYSELFNAREHQGYKHPEHSFEVPYVVRFHNANVVAEPQPMFTFTHPNFDLHSNDRFATAEFEIPYDVTVHGLAGYFDCILYKDIVMSIHPLRHSPDLYSWFSIFFPFVNPERLCAGEKLVAQMWRLSDDHSVWFEWAITQPRCVGIHNPNGRSYKIGL